jgi:hypothetical protein
VDSDVAADPAEGSGYEPELKLSAAFENWSLSAFEK